MIFSFNSDFEKFKRPLVRLCGYAKEFIGYLDVLDFSVDLKILEFSEASFKCPKYYTSSILGKYKNPYYDEIKFLCFIHIENIGYFIVNNTIDVTDGVEEYKEVKCYSCEYMFSKQYLDTFIINMGTTGSRDNITYLNENQDLSLIHIITKNFPLWQIDESISNNYKQMSRSFEIDRLSVFDFMRNELYESFEIVILFDIENFIIYSKDIASYGNNVGFRITKNNLADKITLNFNENNIVTALTCSGGENTDFRILNCGSNKITNLNYFKEYLNYYGLNIDEYEIYKKPKNTEYLNEYLDQRRTVKDYNNFLYTSPTLDQINIYSGRGDISEDDEDFGLIDGDTDFQRMYEHKIIGYEWAKTELNKLQDFIDNFTEIYAASTVSYENFMMFTGKKDALKNLKPVIQLMKSKDTEYKTRLQKHNEILISISNEASLEYWLKNIKHSFSSFKYSIYQSLIIEDQLTDDSFIVTDSMWEKDINGNKINDYKYSSALNMIEKLKERCENELSNISMPQISFECDMANIFQLPEYKALRNSFALGNYFLTEVNLFNEEKVRLQEIHMNFDNPSDFSCIFSNQIKFTHYLKSNGQKFKKTFINNIQSL